MHTKNLQRRQAKSSPGTTRFSPFPTGGPSEEAIKAAREVLHDCFCSVRNQDRTAASQLIAGLSPDLWPDDAPPFIRFDRGAIRYALNDVRTWVAARRVTPKAFPSEGA